MSARAPVIEIVRAESPDDFASAKQLIIDYVAWLGVDLTHQNFDEEMAAFPGKYGPPKGAVLLAKVSGAPAGVVMLHPLEEDGVCEMKRLWVSPTFQGNGIGRLLCDRLYVEGRRLGYRRMRLDTLVRAEAATQLYRNDGFREIDAYCFNPEPDALYFERDL